MVRELSELLADSVDARTRSVEGLTPDADDLQSVVRTVRRRRAVRHTLQSLAAVPIVAGLAAGAYLGIGALQSQPTPPAVTPDVVAPSPTLEKGELLSEPGLPPHHEAPADLAAHVGAGWTALTYRPFAANQEGIDAEPTEHALFLVAPDGTIYRSAWLQANLEISLLHWDVESAHARVSWTGGSDRPITTGLLDVFTGELTEDGEQFSQWARYVGLASDGAEIWVEDPPHVEGEQVGGVAVWSVSRDGARRTVAEIGDLYAGAIDPSGARMLAARPETDEGFAVLELGPGETREVQFGLEGQSCAVVGWLDATSVATLCHDPVSPEAAAAMDRIDFVAQDAGLYRVHAVAGDQPELLHTFADGDPVPEAWTGTSTGEGSFAFVTSSGFPGGCSLGVGAWDGSQLRTVLGPGEHGSNMFRLEPGGPGSVLVTSSQSCESSGVQGEVTLVDVVTGAARVLTPWLEASPADGIDYWHQTVTSAAVAH